MSYAYLLPLCLCSQGVVSSNTWSEYEAPLSRISNPINRDISSTTTALALRSILSQTRRPYTYGHDGANTKISVEEQKSGQEFSEVDVGGTTLFLS